MNRTLTVGASPRITIETVDGDLSIVGWEGEDLLIKGDEDEIRFQHDPEAVTVSSSDDLSLRVPKAASLHIMTVNGDMALRGVTGPVELQTANGDLSIRDVKDVSIGTVNGDLSLRGAQGNLNIQSLNADASVRDVEGAVHMASVADDLALREVRGNINVNVGADVIIYLDPTPGQMCNVTAGDDIMLVLPPKADATLTLSGDEIQVDLPGVEHDEDAGERVITLGNGSAQINLKAGSDIRVGSEAGERGEEFGNFAGMMFDWSDFGEALGERISRRVQQATQRAERQASTAARRAEQKLRGARVRGNVDVGRWNWDIQPGSFPASQRDQADPVTEEERMAILKMLQEKKITAEQADKLLAALEGGG
jgi:hypothetical protein